MAQYVNCFTVVAGSVFKDGIPWQQGIEVSNGSHGELAVCLAPRLEVRLGLGTHATTMPVVSNQRLLLAEVSSHGSFHYLVRHERSKDRLIVRVIAHELYFQHRPIATGLNLWSGGDGRILPFKQFGGHNETNKKDQLYEILEGEFIVLTDSKGSMVTLVCRNGQPVITEVDAATFAAFLVERATMQGTRSAVKWARGNLETVSEYAHDPNARFFAEARTALQKLNL